MPFSDDALRNLLALEAAAHVGPWEWSPCYEMALRRGGYDLHWAFINPKHPDGGVGDGTERVVNHRLVLLATKEHGSSDNPLPDADMRLLAAARNSFREIVTDLLAARARLAVYDAHRETILKSLAWSGDDGGHGKLPKGVMGPSNRRRHREARERIAELEGR